MDRIPQAPPPIHPLTDTTHRPLWSVMIPAFNCARFLPQALGSVLQQALPPHLMQIEVVDDASTDADVEALVLQLGQGRVSYFRQPTNVGSLRNFETCLNRARGQLVHLLHGDDRVLEGFYEQLGSLLAAYPQAGAAFCNHRDIDEQGRGLNQQVLEQGQAGVLGGWLEKIAQHQRLQYVSMVVRRSVYEQLGSFYGVTYGEDWEMWVRIARHYPVAYTPELLAEYRTHNSSISNQKLLDGQVFSDLMVVIQNIKQHLPEDKREEMCQKSMRYYTQFALYMAFNTWENTGDSNKLILTLTTILKQNASPELYSRIMVLFLKKSLKRLWIKSFGRIGKSTGNE